MSHPTYPHCAHCAPYHRAHSSVHTVPCPHYGCPGRIPEEADQ